ncbi:MULTISPECIES: hypothetical protein [Sphingomonas]|uniref:hypothetical protein n=1 Tax=Sphingomonas TaxID=13687 RepID=UPI000F7DD67F|nr:hypothetical protein [Sphingomonas sp. ABOLF]RSV14649.1 hypothetical protein CA235_11255 [Sphingomonas sp. ABOLF]GLK19251.1 hypothetical protein GCM10017606_00770 [Microbacterium terregens]
MITPLKSRLKAVVAYLGDAAHRRFVATLVALLATHLLGEALDADRVALIIEIAIGGLAGSWSATTPQIEGE